MTENYLPQYVEGDKFRPYYIKIQVKIQNKEKMHTRPEPVENNNCHLCIYIRENVFDVFVFL